MYLTVGGSDDGTVLQNDLSRLYMWESQWDMEFNPSKCKVVLVTTARKAVNTVYRLQGQVLEVVTSAKFLGLISPVAYPGTPIWFELPEMLTEH